LPPGTAALPATACPVLQLEILGAHARKKSEEAESRAALAAALAERDTEGRDLVAAYDKVHKHVMRAAAAAGAAADDPAATEEQVRGGAAQAGAAAMRATAVGWGTVNAVAAGCRSS
jgi:hypothetical protein